MSSEMAKAKNLADVAKRATKKRRPSSVEPPRMEIEVVDKPTAAKNQFTALQILVCQAFVRGYTVGEIASKYQRHLVPHEPDRDKRMRKARGKIRRWMASQKFRDLIWDESVSELDLKSPRILNGVARKAMAGRVDAARLSLEVTGRHAPHTEVQPAQINIQFGDIPRPERAVPIDELDRGTMLDSDEEIEDAEWEEA